MVQQCVGTHLIYVVQTSYMPDWGWSGPVVYDESLTEHLCLPTLSKPCIVWSVRLSWIVYGGFKFLLVRYWFQPPRKGRMERVLTTVAKMSSHLVNRHQTDWDCCLPYMIRAYSQGHESTKYLHLVSPLSIYCLLCTPYLGCSSQFTSIPKTAVARVT